MAKNFTYDQIKQAVETTLSARQAAYVLKCKYDTFRKYAIKFGMFRPNKSGKGMKKTGGFSGYNLLDILQGKYPYYRSHLLKIKLVKAGFKKLECEKCGWCKKSGYDTIPVELHHINGDHTDHCLENLQILCPNCHALTDSYCSRKRASKDVVSK